MFSSFFIMTFMFHMVGFYFFVFFILACCVGCLRSKYSTLFKYWYVWHNKFALLNFQEECLQRLQSRIDIPYDSSIPEHQVPFLFKNFKFKCCQLSCDVTITMESTKDLKSRVYRFGCDLWLIIICADLYLLES